MSSQQSYRRVAMVIASLDRRAADAILERFPGPQAESIRQMIMSLSEVDHEEQRRAIRDFMKPAPPPRGAAFPRIAVTPQAGDSENGRDEPPRSTSDIALRSLQHLSDQEIAACVYRERVATIAATVALLPGKRAAGILRLLDPAKQPQVLNALGHGVTPHKLLVESLLRSVVDQHAAAAPALGPQHRDALQAILDEVDEEEQRAMLENLASTNPLLARRLGWHPALCERKDTAE